MTREEAEEILEEYYKWDDINCSCHINPPCSKCVDCPSKEEFLEALKALG